MVDIKLCGFTPVPAFWFCGFVVQGAPLASDILKEIVMVEARSGWFRGCEMLWDQTVGVFDEVEQIGGGDVALDGAYVGVVLEVMVPSKLVFLECFV